MTGLNRPAESTSTARGVSRCISWAARSRRPTSRSNRRAEQSHQSGCPSAASSRVASFSDGEMPVDGGAGDTELGGDLRHRVATLPIRAGLSYIPRASRTCRGPSLGFARRHGRGPRPGRLRPAGFRHSRGGARLRTGDPSAGSAGLTGDRLRPLRRVEPPGAGQSVTNQIARTSSSVSFSNRWGTSPRIATALPAVTRSHCPSMMTLSVPSKTYP